MYTNNQNIFKKTTKTTFLSGDSVSVGQTDQGIRERQEDQYPLSDQWRLEDQGNPEDKEVDDRSLHD